MRKKIINMTFHPTALLFWIIYFCSPFFLCYPHYRLSTYINTISNCKSVKDLLPFVERYHFVSFIFRSFILFRTEILHSIKRFTDWSVEWGTVWMRQGWFCDFQSVISIWNFKQYQKYFFFVFLLDSGNLGFIFYLRQKS